MSTNEWSILIISIVLNVFSYLGHTTKYHRTAYKRFPIVAQRLIAGLIGFAFTIPIIFADVYCPAHGIDTLLLILQVIITFVYYAVMEVLGYIAERKNTLIELFLDLGANEQSELSELINKTNKWHFKKYTNKEITRAFEELKKQLKEQQSK